MSWISITEAAVQTRLSKPELSALQTVALADFQDDPLPEVIAQVVSEIRGYVSACARNKLGPDGTVPDELLSAAVNRIRFELATRLPAPGLLTEARKEANSAAVRLLERVAGCAFAIVQPESPADDQPAGPAVQLVSKPSRHFTRERMNGL